MRFSTIIIGALMIILCGMLGFAGYTALNYRQELKRVNAGIVESLTVYGTVRSFDKTASVLEFERLNPYQVGGEPLVLRLTLGRDAFIGRQILMEEASIYNGVSVITPITEDLSSVLVAGARIKTVLIRSSNFNSIQYLLVGNPL